MTTRISINNLDSSVTANFSPKISGIAIADNSYTVLDDTAVSVSGGYIIISGSNFVSGCTVLVGSVVATSVSFVNSTTVRAQVPAQAAGSYTVYVTNPDGGLAIRVNGLNYSATPTWVTTSPLTSGLVNTAISIQLSATSNGNVTYALQAGSSLPVGVTLSNVGLLSGTVTGITTDTTYNFTVVATDTELQDTPQAFSITITSNDQYFKNTSLLLSANTPGATFVSDASTNAFNVSVFGDTRPSDLSPYKPGYYSILFDTKTDFVSVPAVTNLTTFAGDFTFETWVYLNDTSVTNWSLWDARQSGATAQPMIFNIDPLASPVTGQGRLMYYNGSYNYGTGVVNYNQWTHIAFVRSGSTMTFYVNGVAGGTATVSGTQTASATTNPIYIGSKDSGIAGYGTIGYISNFRIVNGTAVYTGNFTPSTAPLTAITNTVFLIAQSNRYVDNSTNAYALTNSSTSVSSFVPFTPAAGTSTNGSAYFDGTGDYLRSQLDSVNIRTAFTIEAWVYLTTTSGFILFSASNTANVAGSNLYLNISGGTIYFGDGVINNITFSSSLLVTNIWNHIAITFDGTTYRVFVNGTLAGSSTTLLANNTLNGIDIGARISENLYITGYISNFRVVKGTAVYTATFTPPTAPLTAIANTSLLTLQTNQPANNNQFVDRSTNNFLITRNGNATPGSFSPYAGGWSNYFNGLSSLINLGYTGIAPTGDFNIEMWFYANSFDAQQGGDTGFLFIGGTATTNGRLNIGITNTGVIYLYMINNSGTVIHNTLASNAGAVSLRTWTHVAVVRSSNVYTIYVNGTSVATATNATAMTYSSDLLYIGIQRVGASTKHFDGYISNFRMGTVALYTGNFTPSTTPLQPASGTIILTCQSNRLVDNSARNNDIAGAATAVTVQKFSPFSMQTQTVPTSYSVYFDGSGDYLTTPSTAALAFGSSDFCLELWIYTTAFGSTDGRPLGNANAWAANAWSLHNDHTTANEKYTFWVYNYNSNSPMFTSTSSTSLNTWTHVAITRSGNSWRMFINGVQEGSTVTSSAAMDGGSSHTMYIAGSGNANEYMTGYMSNFRAVKGAAVYTSNFTPSTAPLTAIANTSLLACQSTTLIDNSANAFAITANGNTRPSTVNPFGYTNPAAGAYTVTALGGSMYFDGTGDWLSIPNASTPIGTGDFTVECWVYPTALGSFDGFISSAMDGGGALGISLSRDQAWIGNNSTIAINYNWSASILVGRWHHLAVTRSGTTVRFFVNGVLLSSGTASTNMNSTQYAIGRRYPNYADYYPTGYISDARVITGSALYTSNFVPPAAPLDPVRNTVLLLRGTAAGVYDSTMNNNLETVGDARINTSITRFASRPSIFFDGAGDRLIVPSSPNFDFPADFTIEMWINFTNVTSTWEAIIGRAYGVAGGWRLYKNDANNQLRWYSNLTSVVLTSGSTLANNTWSHIAVVRNSGTITIYIDGVARGSAANSTSYTPGNYALEIGEGVVTSAYPFEGYIQDLRITKGVARYTANFTPPASPFIQY